MKKAFVFTFLIIQYCSLVSLAQKSIVVLGSSTAYGTGATTYDSAWVGRLQLEFRKNTADGVDTTITNLAMGAYVTYQVMPTGFVPPANRPATDEARNVTKALSLSPDIVIINLPSNDIAYGYSKAEVMNNFRTLFQTVTTAPGNIKCFITTTQPRNLQDATMRRYQRDLADSIEAAFGKYAINFWDDLSTTDGNYNIRPEVDYGDGIHVNNLGHRLLFERVKAKDIFNIDVVPPVVIPPVVISDFNVQLQNGEALIKWHSEQGSLDTYFDLQRSSNDTNFITLCRKSKQGTSQSADYSWTDLNPLIGKSYYRLLITEPDKTSYSKVVTLVNGGKALDVDKIYTTASSLNAEVLSNKSEALELSIIGMSGAIVGKQSMMLAPGVTSITVPISALSTGRYFLRIAAADGSYIVKQFVKLQ